MIITAIQAQVKIAGRYSIFVDGVYSFSLSDIALLNLKIVTGQEITEQQLQEYKRLSDEDKSYALALRYAMMRPRSVWEMTDYLRRKKISDDVAGVILQKLQDYDIVQDESFARSWVESRRLLRSTSQRRLRQELQQKHVPADIIDKVMSQDREETDERQVLRDLVTRKSHRYPDKQKFMQYLARQGFGYDDITAVLSEVSEED